MYASPRKVFFLTVYIEVCKLFACDSHAVIGDIQFVVIYLSAIYCKNVMYLAVIALCRYLSLVYSVCIICVYISRCYCLLRCRVQSCKQRIWVLSFDNGNVQDTVPCFTATVSYSRSVFHLLLSVSRLQVALFRSDTYQ